MAGRDPEAARQRSGVLRGQRIDWSAIPKLRFNDKDLLQTELVRRIAANAWPPVHQVPSPADFAAAVRLALGWALLPEAQIGRGLHDGALVPIGGRRFIDVPLYWQRWRLGSAVLDRLTGAVVSAAAAQLRRMGP